MQLNLIRIFVTTGVNTASIVNDYEFTCYLLYIGNLPCKIPEKFG